MNVCSSMAGYGEIKIPFYETLLNGDTIVWLNRRKNTYKSS